MLVYRIFAAIVLIPLVVITLFYASLPVFAYIMLVICALCAWEWGQFLHLTKLQHRVIFVLVAIIFLSSIYFLPCSSELKQRLFNAILTLSVVWWLIALLLVISYPDSTKYWHNSMVMKVLFACFVIVPFFIGMIVLRNFNYTTNTSTGAIWLLYVFVLVWAADSGAYFVGRAFGKHKLAPKVSPGKTIEGFIGGMVAAAVISLIVYSTNIISIKFDTFMVSSLLAIFASSLGDLTESMFKREAGIKDSGHLIPGHGGILDRVDSLTAAIPIFAALSLHLI